MLFAKFFIINCLALFDPGDGDKQKWGGAASERRASDQGVPVQAGSAGGVRGGQVLARAALREGPVPRVPGKHDRRSLPNADSLPR